MPRRDGTGPLGQGPMIGRDGLCGTGVGPGGYCVCPNCGEKLTHTTGAPCSAQKCPKCGTSMTRSS